MNDENKKYYYRTSNWGGLYRKRRDDLIPEQYNFITGKWEETDDSFDAFYNPSTSDYSVFPKEHVELYIEHGPNPWPHSLPNTYDCVISSIDCAENSYGLIKGNEVVILIKTGYGGNIYGYQNKYYSLAYKINKEFGYSVVVADNPYDNTDSLSDAIKIIKENLHLSKDINIYYIGVSMGAIIGALYGKKHPEIKRMLLINGPLTINIDKIIKGLNELECEKVTLVYGSLDPSYKYAKELKFNKEINVVIKEGMDHNFSQSTSGFFDLPFMYLL